MGSNRNYNVIAKATEFARDLELDQYPDLKAYRVEILSKTMRFLDSEVIETKDGIVANDRHEILDGFGDIAFIAINGIYKELRTSGMAHEEASIKTELILGRICAANLNKKQADGSVLRIEGKVQKPAGWKEPRYEDIL